MDIKLKQYVIVPKKPKMSKGKAISQGCHATFMALEKQKDKKLIQKWKKEGMCVIVLQCKTTLELFGIAEYLKEWKIPHHLYIDEGITEIPMGTPTALATGVLPESKHWVFSTMKMFKG